MSQWWKQVYGNNKYGRSNYPTQKVIAMLGEETDDFPIGSIVVCVCDYDDTITPPGAVRRFFILPTGAGAFQALPTWIPSSTQTLGTKESTVSMVIVGTKIYAISDCQEYTQSTMQSTIQLGVYDLAEGYTGEWTTSEVATGSSSIREYAYPDIAQSGDYLAFAYADLMQYQVLSGWYVAGAFFGSSATSLSGEPTNIRPSVVADAGIVYLHVKLANTGESRLYRAEEAALIIRSANIISDDIGLPDAQLTISDSGVVGILSANSSCQIIFKYYDPAEQYLSDAEIVAEYDDLEDYFGYCLTYRDNIFHAVCKKTLLPYSFEYFKRSASGVWSQDVIEQPPDGDYVKFVALNVKNPITCNQSFWGMSCLDISGTQPYPYWFFGSQDEIVVPPGELGGYYTDGQLVHGVCVDVSCETGALARRGSTSATEILKIADWELLSDETLIYTDGSKLYKFSPDVLKYGDAPIMTWWESGRVSKNNKFSELQWLVADFTSSDNFWLQIINENGDMRTLSMTQAYSGKEMWVGVCGRQFRWRINHPEATQVEFRSIYLHVV